MMSWVQCPCCGRCRDRVLESCGCVVTACDHCDLIEIDPTNCELLNPDVEGREFKREDGTLVH